VPQHAHAAHMADSSNPGHDRSEHQVRAHDEAASASGTAPADGNSPSATETLSAVDRARIAQAFADFRRAAESEVDDEGVKAGQHAPGDGGVGEGGTP